MKNAALLVSAMFVLGLAATGCKSDIEKATDAICACAEKKGDDAKKCMDDASKTAKEKFGDKKPDESTLSDKDKDALKRAGDCGKKAFEAANSK